MAEAVDRFVKVPAIVVTGTACALKAAIPIGLKVVGFSAAGPVAGSTAAAWMSSIATANGGAVAAGSWYAACQSAAMGGASVVGLPVLLTAGAVGCGGYYGVKLLWCAKR